MPAVGCLRVRFLPLEIASTLATRDPHAWLTDQIRVVHAASRGTYGAPRVHAEFTLGIGLGIGVGYNQVELLMARAGI
ncbi:IS3 family transposase, partial [Nocardia gamkensis]